jgi:glycosyltransferase involved in cell wall biosynthesis
MQIKLLSFQPGSLYENGGAGRVLRRLYVNHEKYITTLYAKPISSPIRKGPVVEVAVPTFPLHRPWMRWHLRTFIAYLRDNLFFNYNAKKLVRAAAEIECDVIHVINHGPYSSLLCNEQFANKPLWVSFHDHFSTVSSFEDAQKLWQLADRRLMISKELGIVYQQLFGKRDFELITDGVLQNEVSEPKSAAESPIRIYFAGLLHIDYHPLFRVLADALELLNKDNIPCELILRGTQKLAFLQNNTFRIEYRKNFVTDDDIKREMDEADLLYLPMKFNLPDFYLYSLSTKMVSYLGASGSILYHGPENSAACNLLTKYEAAVNCTSLNPVELKLRIMELLENKRLISTNAKKLAQEQFDLLKLRQQFWHPYPTGTGLSERTPSEVKEQLS